MEDKKIINKKDIILIVVILVIAAGIWGGLTLFNSTPPAEEGEEEATVYGEIFFGPNSIKLVPLDYDQTFSLPINPHVVFEVRDGMIGFIKSNCSDQICVHTGFICEDIFFPFAACLPNGLILTIHDAFFSN